jgi:hypothetical protein
MSKWKDVKNIEIQNTFTAASNRIPSPQLMNAIRTTFFNQLKLGMYDI